MKKEVYAKETADTDWHWKYLIYVQGSESPSFIMGYKKTESTGKLTNYRTGKDCDYIGDLFTYVGGMDLARKLVNKNRWL